MPQPRLVYRVEQRDSELGAFEAMPWEVYRKFERTIGGFFDAHPTPHDDEGLSRRFRTGELDGHVCGCRSLRQLRQWFPKATLPLLEGGDLELTVWKVPPYRTAHGTHQVMFRRDLAECVEQRPLADLYA